MKSIPSTMNKIRIQRPGGYGTLECAVVATPNVNELKDDEVLVEIHAAGINYADVCVRLGVYASAKQFIGWPITPGFEFSGIVKATGQHVNHFKLEELVMGMSFFGAYAEYIVVKEWQLYSLKPEYNLSLEQAAGIPAVFLTAYHALCQNVVTRPGMKILIHSAAGGVGQALVQIAHILKFEITAIVGRTNKVAYVKETLKAHHVIDKSSESWVERIKDIAANGYDLILDPNGASTLKHSYQALAPMGKLLIYGFHSMLPQTGGKITPWHKLKMAYFYLKTPRFNPLFMTSANKSLISFNLSFLLSEKALLREAMEAILKWISEGKLSPPPITCYPLNDVACAHRAIESGKTQGKLVLVNS